MTTEQETIENLPIASDSISDHKPFKKYQEEKDLLTNMLNPKIDPFNITIGEFQIIILLKKNCHMYIFFVFLFTCD